MADPSTGGDRATGAPGPGPRRRLQEIEDRKIGILMELAEIGRGYDERVVALQEEYDELDKEHYLLRIERIARGRSSMPLQGDGEP